MWLVAVGLLALGGLVLYPVIRYGAPVVPHVFDHSEFSRAFAALMLELFAVLAAAGVAMVLLAVGLVRGSRASQLLTCLLCSIVAIAEIVQTQQSAVLSARPQEGIAVGIALVALVVIVLIVVPPGARAFFAADDRPAGVVMAVATNSYLGAVAVTDAVLLMVAGVVAVKFVWIGCALAVAGLAVLGPNRALRNGSPGARILTLGAYAGLLITTLVLAHDTSSWGDPNTLVPVGLIVISAVGLTAPPSSSAHFRSQQPRSRTSAPALVGWVALLALLTLTAAFGFHASSTANEQQMFQASETAQPESPASAPATSITEDDATNIAQESMGAMDGSGSVNTCDGGSLPTTPIYDYRIGEVNPQTDGSFDVTVDVSLSDGTYEAVSYTVKADSSNQPCVETDTFATSPYTPAPNSAGPSSPPSSSSEPSDVPSLPSNDDPVPTDASPPGAPSSSQVVSYTDESTTPTGASQLLEWSPSGLDSDQAAAVREVIGFMTQVNRQAFQPAWELSTERLGRVDYSAAFHRGYRSTRFYQVALGQPTTVSSDLIVVPGRFVSRQDPAAQGYPDGVTDCTYWPQYVFVVVRRGGRWLLDVAGKFGGRSALDPYRRDSGGSVSLNPLAQRVSC